MRASETLDDEHLRERQDVDVPGEPEPGLILIFSESSPAYGVIPLVRGGLGIPKCFEDVKPFVARPRELT